MNAMNVKTRKAAEKVLKAVLARYPEARDESVSELDRPTILDYDGTVVVSWESGPYEWAYRFTMGGTDWEVYHLATAAGVEPEAAREMATEEPVIIPGVYAEPYYSFSLGVYPE